MILLKLLSAILVLFVSCIFGQGIYVTLPPSLQVADRVNELTGYGINQNQERFARQMQSAIQSPYGNGYSNNNNNNNNYGQQQRYIGNVYDLFSSRSRTLDRQNGQIPLNPFERRLDSGSFKYPSQFFAAQNAARREDQQNVNKEYVNPGYEFGNYPNGPGYLIKNYVNQGQYRVKPQPYEPEFYTTTATSLSISQSQNLARERQNEKWQNLRTYGIQNQEPQGLLQEQLREPWNQSYENQVGLTEHIQQIASRGYGK
uniref:Uncharacterized protein n=1 Tax=Panagrolaimus sp. ES5 TaxID=591445 RepID=A0AC34F6R2_9BILA